jgi:hypothetical protein
MQDGRVGLVERVHDDRKHDDRGAMIIMLHTARVFCTIQSFAFTASGMPIHLQRKLISLEYLLRQLARGSAYQTRG